MITMISILNICPHAKYKVITILLTLCYIAHSCDLFITKLEAVPLNLLHLLQPPLQSFPLATTHLFSVSMNLFSLALFALIFRFHVWMRSCAIPFSRQREMLISFGIVPLDPSLLSQTAEVFCSWALFHCICIPHLLYSFVYWQTLKHIHILAVVNNAAALNIRMHMSFFFSYVFLN